MAQRTAHVVDPDIDETVISLVILFICLTTKSQLSSGELYLTALVENGHFTQNPYHATRYQFVPGIMYIKVPGI